MTSRRRRAYECGDYLAFARRIIRAAARRVAAEGDPADLAELVALRREIDQAIHTAVVGLRDQDTGPAWSWAEIARELGISRQAAQQAYSRRRVAV